jgi:hypothetical protein
MDMMTGISPAYGTLSEVTGDSSNQKCEDTNGSEDDRETRGSIVEVTAADRQGIVSNNDTSDSSALSISTTVAKTMFFTPSWIDSPWTDLSGEHVPPAIPVWINALKMVDRSPSHIRVPPGVGTGFWWPDPTLFTHTESKLIDNMSRRVAEVIRVKGSYQYSDLSSQFCPKYRFKSSCVRGF